MMWPLRVSMNLRKKIILSSRISKEKLISSVTNTLFSIVLFFFPLFKKYVKMSDYCHSIHQTCNRVMATVDIKQVTLQQL